MAQRRASSDITIGFLHPGEMGAALARSARANVSRTAWCAAGRSHATHRRAGEAGMHAVPDLATLCEEADVLISCLPSDTALSTARDVARHGFQGIFVECNAISARKLARIRELIEDRGADLVDAAIIGPPPRRSTEPTVMLLAGARARYIADVFANTELETICLDSPPGSASSLKLCHSAVHKGLHALMLITLAEAEANGFVDTLKALWSRRASTRGYAADLDADIARTRKAYRFASEMAEVADQFESHGLSGTLATAMSENYRRIAETFDRRGARTTDDLLRALYGSAEHA